jgi:hypothetical protein
MRIFSAIVSLFWALLAIWHAYKRQYDKAAYFMAFAAWLKP